MGELKENVIEWITGSETLTVTLTQQKYITKVEKLAEKWPDMVEIVSRNTDGSILAHLPLKALKLSIIVKEDAYLKKLWDERRNNS